MQTVVDQDRGTVPWLSFSTVVLLAFVATLPLGVTRSFGPVDLVHLTLLCTVGVVPVLRVTGGMTPWRWHPSAVWLLVLAVLQVVSMVAARDPMASVRSVVTMTMGMALALTVHTVCSNADRWRALVMTLAVMGAVVGIFGLLTAGTLETQFAGAGALSGRAEGVFNQPNQLGSFSAVLLMVGWGMALGARNRLETWLGAACALLSAANLVLSFSRGAWVGAALGAVLLAVLTYQRHGRRFVRAVLALAAVLVPLALLLTPRIATLVVERVASISDIDANPDDNRLFIYQEAYRQIVQRPVLGQGPGNFQVASTMIENTAGGVGAAHAHNLVLQVAAESGLVSLTVLLVLAVSLGGRVWQTCTELAWPDVALVTGLAAATLTVLGQGMVDFTLGNPILLYLTWTVVGGLLAVSDRRSSWRLKG